MASRDDSSPLADRKSDTSWETACSGQRTGGPWSKKEQLWHINCLEVCAVFLAAKTFTARNHDPPEDRQHDNSCLHQQTGGNSVPRNEQDSQRTMAMGHPPPSGTSSGCSQHNRERGIQSDERQVRLDARPESLSIYPNTNSLFASRLTTQLPKFSSWRPNPEAVAHDAFLQNWSTIPGHL